MENKSKELVEYIDKLYAFPDGHEKMAEHYDKHAEDYDDGIQFVEHNDTHKTAELIYSMEISKSSYICDFACGSGLQAKELL